MRRSDWLILLLDAAPGGPLDPVRVQKGMFLFAMQAPLDRRERYAFEPYAYGPMSRGLYEDVDRLRHERLLDESPVEDASWRLLELTAAGRTRARSASHRAELEQPEALAQLVAIREEISELNFTELLARVYERYPDYAVNSVFRRRR
jgi:hypothetical protein